MRKLIYIFATMVVAGVLYGCSCTPDTRADEARERAVVAAQQLIDTDHSDTIALQHRILEAKVVQSEYVIAGDSIAVEAFDEAFRDYLMLHDGSLAEAIF